MRSKLMVMALSLLLVSGMAFGAALTANRSTPEAVGSVIELGVFTNVHIYAGAIVAVNSSGYAVPAADAAGYTVLGRAEEEIDNVGGATDAEQIKVRVGTFRWDNSGEITDAHLGDVAYVVNDQCVSAKTNGTYSVIAGMIRFVDAEGVFVDTRQNKWVSLATATTFIASGNFTAVGNAAVGGTLAVTGASTLTGGHTGNLLITGATTNSGGITSAKVVKGASFSTATPGATKTNTFYTVPAGTTGCITNYICVDGGIVTNMNNGF